MRRKLLRIIVVMLFRRILPQTNKCVLHSIITYDKEILHPPPLNCMQLQLFLMYVINEMNVKSYRYICGTQFYDDNLLLQMFM